MFAVREELRVVGGGSSPSVPFTEPVSLSGAAAYRDFSSIFSSVMPDLVQRTIYLERKAKMARMLPNMIYAFTNEPGQEAVLAWLKEQRSYGDTFIGTSGFYSMSAFSLRGPDVKYLVLIDIDPAVGEFYREIKRIMLDPAVNTKEIVLGLLKPYLETVGYSSKSIEYEMPFNWFATDMQFERIKELFCEDRFALIEANMMDDPTLSSIGLALREAGHRIDTIYQSNIASVTISLPTDESVHEKVLSVGRCLVNSSLVEESLSQSYISIYFRKSFLVPKALQDSSFMQVAGIDTLRGLFVYCIGECAPPLLLPPPPPPVARAVITKFDTGFLPTSPHTSDDDSD